MTNHGQEYDEGVRDGRLSTLERVVAELSRSFKDSHESHEKRLRYLEGIAASMLAIIAFTTVLPAIVHFFSAFSSR